MKMYHFNPNDYGDEFFTLAEDKSQAHENLLKFLNNEIKEKKYESYYRDLVKWENVDPLNPATFPCGYTLEEHESGDVVRTEIS